MCIGKPNTPEITVSRFDPMNAGTLRLAQKHCIIVAQLREAFVFLLVFTLPQHSLRVSEIVIKYIYTKSTEFGDISCKAIQLLSNT